MLVAEDPANRKLYAAHDIAGKACLRRISTSKRHKLYMLEILCFAWKLTNFAFAFGRGHGHGPLRGASIDPCRYISQQTY
jgi:hypothetical protein